MRRFLGFLSVALFFYQFAIAQDPVPGSLANSGFENEAIKSVFFFTGNWRNGVQFYDFNPSDNRGLYTLHPSDARHLGWSENQSNRDFAVQSITDQEFAAGFDRVAGEVFDHTGVHVGFALDVLPPDSYAPGTFKATPGYDAHIVFPSSPVYGNTQSWRDLQTQAINDFGSQSLTFNAWNGYTEGMAGVPTVQYGNASYLWMCTHFGGNCTNSTERSSGRFPPENLEILPNPVRGHAEVRLRDQSEHIISYEIVDCKGIILKVRKINHSNAPVASTQIPMEDIFPGLYFLIVKTNRSTYAKMVLK